MTRRTHTALTSAALLLSSSWVGAQPPADAPARQRATASASSQQESVTAAQPPGARAPEKKTPASTPARNEEADALEELRQKHEAAKLKTETASFEETLALAEVTAQKRALEARLELETAQLEAQLATLRKQLELRQLQEQLASEGDARAQRDFERETHAFERSLERRRRAQPVVRSLQPFQNGVLEVSDRRVELDGVITQETAQRITERLSFFNNQSEEPIFVVIDVCRGGSVMAGYRIVRDIESSRAPVHVVVKSYAASMAAVIVTLAENSYALPNAVLLHHQMGTLLLGNMTSLSEQLKQAEEWSRRITVPLTKKLGTTPEAFVRQMYEHDSSGNWSEFGDSAQKLGWVRHVALGVQEAGLLVSPDAEQPAAPAPAAAQGSAAAAGSSQGGSQALSAPREGRVIPLGGMHGAAPARGMHGAAPAGGMHTPPALAPFDHWFSLEAAPGAGGQAAR